VATILTSGFSYGPVQLRLSEALTLLPYIMPEAVWGLTLGCFLANLFGGSVIDMIFGTLATLIAAIITRKIRHMWLTPLPVIICNAVIVSGVLTLITKEFSFITYGVVALEIALSEAIVCYGGGIPVLILTEKIVKE